MSRIGKLPVPLPKGVKVKLEEGKLVVTGPKGTLSQLMPPRVKITIGDKDIVVAPQDDSRLSRSYWGLARTLAANMVIGATDGFSRVLELVGHRLQGGSQGRYPGVQHWLLQPGGISLA